jgi:hypothetical protein
MELSKQSAGNLPFLMGLNRRTVDRSTYFEDMFHAPITAWLTEQLPIGGHKELVIVEGY